MQRWVEGVAPDYVMAPSPFQLIDSLLNTSASRLIKNVYIAMIIVRSRKKKGAPNAKGS